MVDLGLLVARDGAGRSWRRMCRRSAWPRLASRPGSPWSDRVGGPGRTTVVRVPGGLAVPPVGAALGADLPAGQRGERRAAGHPRRRPGGDGVRPDGARRADQGGRAGDCAAAATGALYGDPGSGLADADRPGLCGGPAAGRQRRERGLPGPVHGAGAGLGRRPADRYGARLADGGGLPAAGRSHARGHLPQAAGAGMDRGHGRGHRARARTGRRAEAAGADPRDVLRGPGGLHAADRGARRRGRRRAGRVPGRAGQPVRARAWRRAGEAAGRRGPGPFPGAGGCGAVGAADGGAAPRGRAAASPCRVAAGSVVAQGGDYFGRTVNLAARIAAHAGAGQVLVSGSVVQSPPPPGVAFVEVGEIPLKGFATPVRLLEARRLL